MPGRVENALLHVLEAEQSSHAELRVSAMHNRSPIHTFLFDSQGNLLTANKAALQFCQAGSGQLIVLPCLQCCAASASFMQSSLLLLALSTFCCHRKSQIYLLVQITSGITACTSGLQLTGACNGLTLLALHATNFLHCMAACAVSVLQSCYTLKAPFFAGAVLQFSEHQVNVINLRSLFDLGSYPGQSHSNAAYPRITQSVVYC